MLFIFALAAILFMSAAGPGPENELELVNPYAMTIPPKLQRDLETWYSTGLASRNTLGDDEYEIVVDDGPVIKDGDYVTIKFSRPVIDKKDWIAVYSPADVDITSVVPVKYTIIDKTDAAKLLEGELKVQLINMRSTFSFYFMRGPTDNPTAVARATAELSFDKDELALRPRVIPGRDTNEYQIRWTNSVAPGTKFVLQYGSSPDDLTNVVQGTSTTLSIDDLCEAPANTIGWFDLGESVYATIPNAHSVGPRIYYRIKREGTDDVTETYSFKVMTKPGSTYPTSFIAFDDLGRGSYDDLISWRSYGAASVNTSVTLAGKYQSEEMDTFGDLVWHVGDISYANGYLPVWDWYMYQLSNEAGGWANRVPYAVQVGNHELGTRWIDEDGPSKENKFSFFNNTDSGGECGMALDHVVPLPANKGMEKPWYYIETGPFVLIAASSEHNITRGSPQHEWLENTLKNIDRKKSPWVIFGSHRPMYIDSTFNEAKVPNPNNPNSGDQAFAGLMLEHVEPLLVKYKVSLCIYGHNHAVQRLSAAYQNKTVLASTPSPREIGGKQQIVNVYNKPTAPVHVVWGTGGADFTPNCAECGSKPITKPEWSEKVFYIHGFGRVTALSDNVLQMDYYSGDTGDIVDRMEIVQDLNQDWIDTINDNKRKNFAKVVGGVIGGVALVSLCVFVIRRRKTNPVPQTDEYYEPFDAGTDATYRV